jgi:hypothetical protein
VAGSKVKPWDFAKAVVGLAMIYWHYLRPRAPHRGHGRPDRETPAGAKRRTYGRETVSPSS